MVILRVDVDNAYNFYKRFPKGGGSLNTLRLSHGLFAISQFGYLEDLRLLVEDLDDRGLRATFFFKATTIPQRDMRERILRSHAVGFHAVRTARFEDFKKDFKKVNKSFHDSIMGMSKHGDGTGKAERRHTWQYDPERCIGYAGKLGLRYFSGNGKNPEEKKTIVNGIVYFPSAFWINRMSRTNQFTIEWLINESQNRDVVVLFHPLGWRSYRQVRNDYEAIVDKCDAFKTFDEVTIK